MKKHNGFHFFAALSFCDVFARDSNVKKGIRIPTKWMFVDKHVKNHCALGKYFVPLKGGSIKMGDTPAFQLSRTQKQ